MKRIALILLCAAPGTQTAALGADRPNILWITCEDISPYLGCYGDENAVTPNLDKLAEDVLPLVKRILEIEAERLSNNFR